MENSNSPVRDDTAFLSIIDSLPVTVIITDPDLSIRYVNPVFTRLTGFSLDDVKGARAPYPWWPKERQPEYLDELSVVRKGRSHKSDWLFEAKDGHLFWIKANVAPVVKDGKVQYLIACWADITENIKTAEGLH